MKFQTGEKAINWVKPDNAYVSVWGEEKAYEDVTFSTQTSMIRCWYEGLSNVFVVHVHHKGKKMGMKIAAEAAGTKEGALLVKQSFMDGYDLGDTDRKVISALFGQLFGPEEPGKWSGVDNHISWKDEIAEFKGGYASGGYIDHKIDVTGSYKDYMAKTEYYQKQAMLYQKPYVFEKNPFSEYTHKAPAKYALTWYEQGVDTSHELQNKSQELPGVNEQVKHPVTGGYTTLARTIINLNDYHKWTREAIADWIETLDIDTTFPVEYTEPNKEEV